MNLKIGISDQILRVQRRNKKQEKLIERNEEFLGVGEKANKTFNNFIQLQ